MPGDDSGPRRKRKKDEVEGAEAAEGGKMVEGAMMALLRELVEEVRGVRCEIRMLSAVVGEVVDPSWRVVREGSVVAEGGVGEPEDSEESDSASEYQDEEEEGVSEKELEEMKRSHKTVGKEIEEENKRRKMEKGRGHPGV